MLDVLVFLRLRFDVPLLYGGHFAGSVPDLQLAVFPLFEHFLLLLDLLVHDLHFLVQVCDNFLFLRDQLPAGAAAVSGFSGRTRNDVRRLVIDYVIQVVWILGNSRLLLLLVLNVVAVKDQFFRDKAVRQLRLLDLVVAGRGGQLRLAAGCI